jgi:hypothetical protein
MLDMQLRVVKANALGKMRVFDTLRGALDFGKTGLLTGSCTAYLGGLKKTEKT